MCHLAASIDGSVYLVIRFLFMPDTDVNSLGRFFYAFRFDHIVGEPGDW